jgi:predicted NBD/HSP70 family sugar kinase
VHFYIAFFVGGGVVLDGRLFQGRSGNAGALGSMPVPDRAGHIRQLIELASLAVLEARVIEAGLDPALLWNSPDHWDLPPDLVDGWVDQAAEGIAHAIHAALAVIDLPVVKIDGWMPADLRTKIATRVREKLAGLDLTGLDVPAIQEGTMGPDARAIGAASQPLLARFIMGYTR